MPWPHHQVEIEAITTRGASNYLLVQVIWQYGTEGTKKYELKSGVVVCRTEAHLEQFEVFRTTWEQENGRRPLQSEVEALDECFWPLLI